MLNTNNDNSDRFNIVKSESTIVSEFEGQTLYTRQKF